MKTKDFFNKLKTDGKINDEKFVAFIETLPDLDIPDEAVAAFEKSFLTIERSKAHPEVHGELMRKNLGPVDNDLKAILSVIEGIDKSKADEIQKSGENTYKRLAAIKEYLPDMINRLKVPAGDEEAKKEVEKLKSTIAELTDKFTKVNGEMVNKEKFWKDESEKTIKNFKLGQLLENKANRLTFGKAYADADIRAELTKSKLDALRAANRLELVEQDGAEPVISVLDNEGKPRFVNGGNTPITVENLLEDAFKKYLKASNSDDDTDTDKPDPQSQSGQQRQQQGQPTKARTGARTTVQ